MDATHNPQLESWVTSANGHPDFPIQNLPHGVFSPAGGAPRGGVAIGDAILDLGAAVPLLPGAVRATALAAAAPTLNGFFALGAKPRRDLRIALSALLAVETAPDLPSATRLAGLLHPSSACTLHLPCTIGDYTDFFAGIHHARNGGLLFRPENPLLPNYKYVPVAYHGRASSVRAPGSDVWRPKGQRKLPSETAPS
jgi:fumarylacetoacetase